MHRPALTGSPRTFVGFPAPLHESVWKPETPGRNSGATPSHGSEADYGGDYGQSMEGAFGNTRAAKEEPEDYGSMSSAMERPDMAAASGGPSAAAGGEAAEESAATVQWRCVNVKVKITSSGEDGVIVSVDSGRRYTVKALESAKETTLEEDQIERVQPEKEKEVIVVSGPDKGQRGLLYVRAPPPLPAVSLLPLAAAAAESAGSEPSAPAPSASPSSSSFASLQGIDGEDGIVQLPEDIKILDMWR